MKKILFLAAVVSFLLGSGIWAVSLAGDEMHIKEQIKKFVPVEIKVDPKLINAKQKKFMDELVKAAGFMNEIFLRQVWDGNVALRDKFQKENKLETPEYKYFSINMGPFDRLDHGKPFIDGVGSRPAGANFYPTNLTKKEFEDWINAHPKDKETFKSYFTVIKRKGKDLVAVPYSEEYRQWLEPATKHLKKAAELTDNPSLKKYLNSRADAFLSNNYYDSDVDWVHLKNHDFEIVFGPYETYEDELFGYKAAFETFITRVDPEETARLEKIMKMGDELKNQLPLPDNLKKENKPLESAIVVALEVYTAGDARRGVQTLAFNLPNEETIRNNEGSKNVMLKNVMHAKFDKILTKIAGLTMSPEDVANVDFDAFFAHTLLHEVSHSMSPGDITKDGKPTTVRKELKDLYSTIEEATADTLSAYNNLYLAKKGIYPKDFEKVLWPTYLAGLFRSVRFGTGEAHGGANAIQFNYLWERGAITYNHATGLFSTNLAKMSAGITDLSKDLLSIEAKGDYKSAKDFVAKYRVVKPELERALKALSELPVDINPVFVYK